MPVFAQCVLSLFSQGVSAAVAAFATSLANYKWLRVPVAQRKPAVPTDSASGAVRSAADDQLAAAHSLLEHPPIAVLVNGVISALNTVRGAAMLRCSAAAAELVAGAMRQACAMLTHQASTRALGDAEAAVHADACKAMVDVAAPLLLSMYRTVFSAAASQPDLADALGPLRTLVADAAEAAQRTAASQAPQRTTSVARTPPQPRASGTRTAPSPSPASVPPATLTRAAPPPAHGTATPTPPSAAAPPHAASSPVVLPPAVAPPRAPAPAAPPTAALPAAPRVDVPPPMPAPPVAVAVSADPGFGGFAGSEDSSDADDDANDAW